MTGKTHTMIGNQTDPGVMMLFVNNLYKRINMEGGEVYVSFFEYAKEF